MFRRDASTIATVAIVLALVGCSDAPAPDPETEAAIQTWSADLEASLPNGVSTIGGSASFDDEPTEGTRIDFETPASFDRLEFSCFGDGTMDLAVTAVATDGTTGSRIEELPCDESPHVLDRALNFGGLESLSADAYNSSDQSAWLLIAHPNQDD